MINNLIEEISLLSKYLSKLLTRLMFSRIGIKSKRIRGILEYVFELFYTNPRNILNFVLFTSVENKSW